jgi:esterase/lipase
VAQTQSINLAAGDNVVLLLHGLAGSPLEMRYLADALHQQGLSVEVPHIRAMGTGDPQAIGAIGMTARSAFLSVSNAIAGVFR